MELAFVGRTDELSRLTDLFDQASHGRGGFAIVSGEAGVGKTRLVKEFVGHVTTGTVIFVAAHELTESPLRLWRSVVRSAIRKLPGVADNVLASHDDDVHDMADLADDLLGLLIALPAPVVIVLEDIQWADPASQRLLGHVATAVYAEPILFVATRRTGLSEPVDLESEGPAHFIDVVGIPASDLTDALAVRYPKAESGQVVEAASRLTALTGGNPLASFGTLLGLERTLDKSRVLAELTRATARDVEAPSALRGAIAGMLESSSHADREVLAAVALSGSTTPHLLAQITTHHEPEVIASRERALTARLLIRSGDEFSLSHPLVGSTLLDELPQQRVCEFSARYAEYLAGKESQPDWALAVENAQRSGGLISPSRTMELADLAGQQAMDDLAYEDAQRFFSIAAAHDDGDPGMLAARTQRLMHRAVANVRIGRMDTAYELYQTAADNAEVLGDAQTLARAAFGFAFPPDWRAGNPAALELLLRAEHALATSATPDSQESRAAQIQLMALRSTLEMRIPQSSSDGRQWAWIVRANVAQPRAERAVELSTECDDKYSRLIALLAWRWTHRAPRFLAQRTVIAREALDIALELNSPQQILEASVRLVVDHLEAGNRQAADEVVAIAEWTNERARDAWVRWRTCGLRAGLAGIDGDWEEFEELRRKSFAAGIGAMIPGAAVMDHTLRTQRSIIIHDIDHLLANEQMLDYVPMHPLTSSAVTLASAQMGRIDDARDRLDQTFALLDDESSLLQCLAYMGQAAVLIGDQAQSAKLLPLLEPWRDRVAIDAEALMCSGALGLIIADVATVAGDPNLARSARQVGTAVDRRLHRLNSRTGRGKGKSTVPTVLTDREHEILREIARGRTNAEIAVSLNFSLATVRRDTISIYNKLNVRGRANAASRGVELGLLTR